MLESGLFELLVIAIIALLVVGPEKMPSLIRTVVGWIQRTRRFISSVQQDIERDIQTEKIQPSMHQVPDGQDITEKIQDTITTTKNTLDTIRYNSKL